MKRFFMLLLSLLPAFVLAEGISEEKAEQIAARFMAADRPSTRAEGMRLVWNGEERATRSSEQPAYYVFAPESGRGFVIVSGDERTMPILGYSFEETFSKDAMPDNLRQWMADLRLHVLSLRAAQTLPSPQITAAWQAALTGPNPSAEPVVELQTALWDQRAPYNSKLAQQGWVTGCPATAIAIIMRYHQWPEKGVGTIPQYREEIPAIELGHTYDWAQMPLTYNDLPSQYQKDQVGILMRDVGAMVRTDYRGGSAGAKPEQTLPQLMPIFMRYNAQTIQSIFKKNFSNEEWNRLMQKELDEHRPILYGGYSSGGGHQFVLDGYAKGNYYHVNWGWSGVSNGYYLLTDMNPPQQGAGGSSSADGFVNKQDAIIGIQPDPSNPGGGNFDLIEYKQLYKGKPYGLISSTTEYAVGREFTINIQEFRNVGSRQFAGQIAVGHFDAAGNLKEIVSKKVIDYGSYPIDIYDFTETMPKPCTIREPIVKGDRLMGVFKHLAPSEWTPIAEGKDEGCIFEIILEGGAEPEPEPEPTTNDLEQHVKMTYDKDLGQIEILCEKADAVTLAIANAMGNDVTTYCTQPTATGFRIDTTKVNGTLTLTLTSPTRGIFEFEVVLAD